MISAVIITKNEEKNIKECIKTVLWCSEIIVIDDNSIDKTREIAGNVGAKVIRRSLDNDFSAQRNYGMSVAKYDWVLFLDADERISEKLKDEILKKIEENKFEGFYIKRVDYMWEKQLNFGDVGGVKLLRLGKKNAGKWKGNVHEIWDIKGKTKILENPIFHYPHPNLDEFLKELNYYSDIRAQELFKEGWKSSFISIILYTKLKFIYNYFIKLGFLDGIRGLIIAILMSFYSFLVRSKLWLLWQKEN